MITTRIRRMLGELQCEPVTLWLCELFAIAAPRELGPGQGGVDPDEDPPLLQS